MLKNKCEKLYTMGPLNQPNQTNDSQQIATIVSSEVFSSERLRQLDISTTVQSTGSSINFHTIANDYSGWCISTFGTGCVIQHISLSMCHI